MGWGRTAEDIRAFWVEYVSDVSQVGGMSYETLWGISIVDFFTIVKKLKRGSKK